MSDSNQTVRVNLGERSYDIEIGSGNVAGAGPFIFERQRISHAVVITDENVEEPHACAVAQDIVNETTSEADLVVIEAGEASKSIDMAATLWEKLLELGTDRKSVIVAVGGGVIGDLAGFAAATYARGIGFFQMPTTLLAQVDSSVGGKVGINLPAAKNMVGAFLQPRGVLIDISTLATLPERVPLRFGRGGEVRRDPGRRTFRIPGGQCRGPGSPRSAVAAPRGCPLLPLESRRGGKGRTRGDRLAGRFELRAHLRHALESLTGYGTLLHGEAVAIGMLCASRLAERWAASMPRRRHGSRIC